MKEIYLTVRKRAFPSQGRVRFNVAHLPVLGIKEGEQVDLVNEATKKSVTVGVIADMMVREGQVRVSEEDAKSIGLTEDDNVLVRKTPPLTDKIRKAAAGVTTSPSGDPGIPGTTIKQTTRKVKTGTVQVEAKPQKVSGGGEKTATKTVRQPKDAVKKRNAI
jgi:hypothetical protein